LDRFSYAVAALIPPSFFYLQVELAGKPIKNRIVHWVIGFFVLFFALFSLTPFIIEEVKCFLIFEETPGILYPFFMIYFFIVLGCGLFILFKGFKDSSDLRRMQLKYTFLGLGFAYLAAATYLIMMFEPQVPPVYFILEMIYSGIIAYAIFKYQLLLR